MRDQVWLEQLLERIWQEYFSDVTRANQVRVEFGRRAKTRLGSIKHPAGNQSVSVITLNGLFRDPAIPQFVVEATLVHEMCHYAHGFNSPLDQRFRHPHAGGVMRQEFAERGLVELYLEQKSWLKSNWPAMVREHFPIRRRTLKTKRTKVSKPFWFLSS